jgi:hypothetical protein
MGDDDDGGAVEEGAGLPSSWFTVTEPSGQRLRQKRESEGVARRLWEAVQQWAIRKW